MRGAVASHGNARLEQLAFIGLVLGRDSHRHRLQALKPCGRLEIRALLAAMERGPDLGQFPVKAVSAGSMVEQL